ncbi:hypothetical protein CVT24_003126 [Panaeolus cyanescens]|uniref:Protein kinase domain-containing protein n=1 Tax=Panaeolus cyanescens TaxID=181874 RepID=A0A409W1P8_9AGAR|nr:hypothetical protein CVT24_003126 [Panaeolus cyanescens]
MSKPNSPLSASSSSDSSTPTSGSTTPRLSSPLNPASTPTKGTVPLPPSSLQNVTNTTKSSFGAHNRVPSVPHLSNVPNIEESPPPGPLSSSPSSSTAASTPRARSSGLLPLSADGGLSPRGKGKSRSVSKERSRSPARRGDDDEVDPASPAEDASLLEASWYGTKHVIHSWQEPKRKNTKSVAQDDAREATRKKVAKAVASSIDWGADIAHEALYVGVELLDFVPIPGLSVAAKTLLAIWDAAEEVDLNGISCLRLTERCADILISVRQEIAKAGNEIGTELAAPIAKLEESFAYVSQFMTKQAKRPFLKRYLKRDEIFREIGHCDSLLKDAMALFSVSVQLRILTLVQESDKRRNVDQEEIKALMRAIASGQLPIPGADPGSLVTANGEQIIPPPYQEPSGVKPQGSLLFSTDKTSAQIIQAEPTALSPDSPILTMPAVQILPTLRNIHLEQNSVDAALDLVHLRKIMRDALQATSDAEMLHVLQVGENEMPDAIKTLQRALERLAEEEDELSPISSKALSFRVPTRMNTVDARLPDGSLHRAATMSGSYTSISSSEGSTTSGSFDLRRRDTLDWEFMETGIDALRRMSKGNPVAVPSWTITKYEVDRIKRIGVGGFSWVYKGKWRGQTVAVKVLKDSVTPRELFIKEVEIWKTLHHPNVLTLFGASSTTGDPPWFFVSAYMKHGSLVEHLRKVEQERRPPGTGVGPDAHAVVPVHLRVHGRADSAPTPWRRGLSPGRESSLPGSPLIRPVGPAPDVVEREWDLLRFMHEIAKGMEYLHSLNPPVLHGDLKAANVLVDDKYRAVLADFGQSEMKIECYRRSGKTNRGTLRWQPPELWDGITQLNPAVDVWAFSITCVEILTMGRMPWPNVDDETVRYLVLEQHGRPPVPANSRFNTPGLQDIISNCWRTRPELRPRFDKIAKELKLLRKGLSHNGLESPQPPGPLVLDDHKKQSPSPSLAPITLPKFLENAAGTIPHDILGRATEIGPARPQDDDAPHEESTVSNAVIKMPEPVIYTPASSRASTLGSQRSMPSSGAQINVSEYDRYDGRSPPPLDERAASFKNERRYRLNLLHDFHPSLLLPLWDPSLVEIGAVGYLSKPAGQFVTLFNSMTPTKSDNLDIKALRPLGKYGATTIGIQKSDTRTVTQKAYDLIAGSLTFRNFLTQNVSRRHPFPLKAGHKAAYLHTEITEYHYMESLDNPKKWFQDNVDEILRVYGFQHQIQKEDLFLVIGTLRAPNYALFVSHNHPEGKANFNVFLSPSAGQPWGMFTTDKNAGENGPSYPDEIGDIPFDCHSKVSNVGEPWTSVLLARLRFKPDVLEPTSR